MMAGAAAVAKSTIVPRTLGRMRPGIDLVAEADPEGAAVTHERDRRTRMADALHDMGLLTDDQLATATTLRDAWERSRHIQHQRATDISRPIVDGGGGEPNENEAALILYETTMRQVGREARHCLTAIVLHDEHPDVYGRRMRCHGITMLIRCLDRAGRFTS